MIKNKLIVSLFTVVLGSSLFISAQAATLALADYGFNIDSNISFPGDTIPSEINTAGFNFTTGLGNINIAISGAGSHSFFAFFDHEIDAATNTFFNETGSSTGTAATGQSWEIDEPSWVEGDIWYNFQDSFLDNDIGYSIYSTSIDGYTVFPDDVSMAMGWDFNLADGEDALISMILSDVAPTSGFFLTHTDPDSGYSIYLSSNLSITAVPLPGALWLMVSGLIGLVTISRRKV
jgi:hypothetical protein